MASNMVVQAYTMRNVGGVYFTGDMLKTALQYIFSLRSFQNAQRVIDSIDPVAFYYSSQVWTVLNRVLNENAFILEGLGGIALVHGSVMKLGCFEGSHEFYHQHYFMDTSKILMLYFGTDQDRYVTKKDFFTGLLQELLYVEPSMSSELRLAFGYWTEEKIRKLTRFEYTPYNDIHAVCDRITDMCGFAMEQTGEDFSELAFDAFHVENVEDVMHHFSPFFPSEKPEWENFKNHLRATLAEMYNSCTDAECQTKCRQTHLFKLHNQLVYLFSMEKYLDPAYLYSMKTLPRKVNESDYDKSLYKATIRRISNAVTGSLFFLDELKWVIHHAYYMKYGASLEKVIDQTDGGIFHPIVHCANNDVLAEILANFGIEISDIVQITHITELLCGNREVPIPAPNNRISIHPVRALNEIFEVLLIDCNIFNQLKMEDLDYLEECLQPFFSIFQPDRRILYYVEYETFIQMKLELVNKIQPKLVYKPPCPKIYMDWELRKKIGIRSYLGDHKVQALLLPHVDRIVDMIHHDFVKRNVANFETILYPVEFCIFLSRFPQFAHYLHNSRQCGQYSFCLCKLDFENKFPMAYPNCVPELNEEVYFAVQIMKYSLESVNTEDLRLMEERARETKEALAKRGQDVSIFISPPRPVGITRGTSTDDPPSPPQQQPIDERTRKREKNRKKKEKKRANKLAKIETRKEYREASSTMHQLQQQQHQTNGEMVAVPMARRSIGVQVGSKEKECDTCQNLRIEIKTLTNREKENKNLRKKMKELEEHNDQQNAELRRREDKEEENKELKERVKQVEELLEQKEKEVENREKAMKEELNKANSKAEKLENRLRREQDAQKQVKHQIEETHAMLKISEAQTSQMAEEMEKLALEKERLSKRYQENEGRIANLEKELSERKRSDSPVCERRKQLDMYNRRLEIVVKGKWKECAQKLAQEYCDIAVNVSAFIRAKEEIDDYGKSMELYEWCLRKNISIIEGNPEFSPRNLQPVPDFPIMFSSEMVNIIREASTRREIKSNGLRKDDELECMICVKKRLIDVTRKCTFCFRRYHDKCLSQWLKEFSSCAICGTVFLQNSLKNGLSS